MKCASISSHIITNKYYKNEIALSTSKLSCLKPLYWLQNNNGKSNQVPNMYIQVCISMHMITLIKNKNWID